MATISVIWKPERTFELTKTNNSDQGALSLTNGLQNPYVVQRHEENDQDIVPCTTRTR
ncbi:unnamed protein product [Hymenolepis diminuta]|uniref:Uncharacterized protein n=1 Tax=Hymenolepis diminuta TaxID=6216 RepID=A0A564YHZ9_HYMDI|nr:unnamed protein product [Hymenolepis diminuta]